MIRNALIIAGKDLKLFYRHWETIIAGYAAPVLLLIVFGVIYQGMAGGDGEISIRLLWVDQENSARSQGILANLEADDVFTIVKTVPGDPDETLLDEETARDLILNGKAHLALVYHRSVTDEEFPVVEVPVMTLYYDPSSSMEREITAGLLQRAVFSGFTSDIPREGVGLMLEELDVQDTPFGNLVMDFMDRWVEQISAGAGGEEGEEENGGFQSVMESMIDLTEEEVVREEVKRGNPFMANTVAGFIVLFLLFSVSYGAASLLQEQQGGTIKRLLLAPQKVDSIILGKIIAIAVNSLGQVLAMLVVAVLVFKVNVFGNFLMVLIMSIATVAATTSFGMLIAAFARSYEQIQSVITIVVLSMSAIGGSMFPRILMPPWMKDIGLLTINGWAIDGYLDALYYYNGPGSVLGYGEARNLVDVIRNSEALVLVLMALVFGIVATRLFKRRLGRGV